MFIRIFHDTPTLDGFAYKEKTVKTDRQWRTSGQNS